MLAILFAAQTCASHLPVDPSRINYAASSIHSHISHDMLTRMCTAAARAQLPQRMHSARAALPTISRLQPAQAALSLALQLQCRTLSSAPRPSSATMTPAQRVEHELSLSNARRSERARRLEELRELEAQLHEHRLQESVSLSWHARLHWSKHGPIIAAILCAAASMSAAYHLWQTNHVFTQEKNKLTTQIGSIAQQIDAAHRRRTNEQEDSQRVIKGYMQSKVRKRGRTHACADEAATETEARTAPQPRPVPILLDLHIPTPQCRSCILRADCHVCACHCFRLRWSLLRPPFSPPLLLLRPAAGSARSPQRLPLLSPLRLLMLLVLRALSRW